MFPITLTPAERIGFINAVTQQQIATKQLNECVEGFLTLHSLNPKSIVTIKDLSKGILEVADPPAPPPEQA